MMRLFLTKLLPRLVFIAAFFAVALLIASPAPARAQNAPGAPTGLSATPGDGQVALSWDNPDNNTINEYELLRLTLRKLASSDSAADDWLGYSVAVDGDTVVVGAWPDNAKTGSAFVFTRDSSGVWSQQAKLTASDGAADDGFGFSVALGGDTAVIGAPGDNIDTDKNGTDEDEVGSAYVFIRNSSDEWSQAAKLAASDGAAGHGFGVSVAVDFNTVVVGASGDGMDITYAGSAYLFVKPTSDEGWADPSYAGTETVKLTASTGAGGDEFGISVSADGGSVVVGASRYDDPSNGDNSGAAFVFVKPDSDDGWADDNYTGAETAKLTAFDGLVGDEFGRSVAVDDDTVVVGARMDDYPDDPTTTDVDESVVNGGSAYVFTKPSLGWSAWDGLAQTDNDEDTEDKDALTAKLSASDRGERDFFGASVAVEGGTAVVGAYGDDNPQNGRESGAAYLFVEPTSGWATGNETVKLTASAGASGDEFGRSVAVDGDTAAIGAFAFHDLGGGLGSAYMLGIKDWTGISNSGAMTTSHPATGLTNRVQYTFRLRAANDSGTGPASDSVSATPLVPKPAKPTGLSAEERDAAIKLDWADPGDSKIYQYQISEVIAGGLLTAADGAAGDQFGVSVAVDGDTAVVGSYRDDDNGIDSGSAYVLTRADSDSDWTQAVKLTAADGAAGDQFGWSVAMDGDTIVVGAYRHDHSSWDQPGAAYLFVKHTNGWSDHVGTEQAKLTASDAADDDLFGVSVAVDGDTVVVGAPLKNLVRAGDDDLFAVGAAYVFVRPDTGWVDATEKKKLLPTNGLPNDNFGFSVAVVDDTAFIGVIGAEGFGRAGHGSVYIFIKPFGGWSAAIPNARLTASDRAPGDWFGYSVAVEGNTAVVGARLRNSEAGAGSGAAYVFTMDSPHRWQQKAILTASDAAARDNFGVSVAVDDDTVVVGSWLDDDNGRDSGSAYVFTKPDTGWATTFETSKFTAPDGAATDRLGHFVAVSGRTAMIGAYRHDTEAGIDAGSTYVLDIPQWTDISGSNPATTSHTVTGLTNGDHYTYQIRAVNDGGGSPASDAVSATPLGKPAAPVTLNATEGDTQVTLTWSQATGGETRAPITKYQYSTDDGNNYADIPDSGAGTTGYTVTQQTVIPQPEDTTLANGTLYTFAVRAVNVIGEGPSDTADGTPATARPGDPQYLVATAGDTQVRITWDDPNDSSIDEYRYSTDSFTTFKTLALTDIDYRAADEFGYTITVESDDTPLENGTTYTFDVRAVDNEASPNDESNSASVSATPASSRPSKPANLTAGPGDSKVTLAWDDPDDVSIDRYEYSTDSFTTFKTLALAANESNDAGTIEYTIAVESDGTPESEGTPLVNGTTYTFYVRAVDDEASTPEGPADEVSAEPLPPTPGQPRNLTADEGNTVVKLSWQPPANALIEKYEISHGLQPAELGASGGSEGDKFGYAVAVDGDTAVIGAYGDDQNGDDAGAAYIFTWDASAGLWVQASKLTASDGAAYDNFGIAVAVDDDANTVVIGAPGDDGAGASTDSGAAYVFTSSGGVWSQAAKLTAPDGAALDYFGQSVAVDGNTVLVGAYQDDDEDDELEDSGSAYVFTKPTSLGGWNDWDNLPEIDDDLQTEDKKALTTKLTAATDSADDDWFGVSVALDVDTAVIGAPGDDIDGIDAGSAYVFIRVSGTWSRQTKLTASSAGAVGDSLGYSVALDGDTAVVGAYMDDRENDEAAPDAGSAYVFTRNMDTETNTITWPQQAKLIADDGAADDWFGYAVAVDGNTVLVGAYGDDDNGSNSGSAYVFTRELGAWSETNKLTERGGAADDWFGYSVAVDEANHTALVGPGSAHVFDIHDWADIEGSGPDTKSHTVDGLINYRGYDFYVRAVNIAGAGDEADESAVPQAPNGGGGAPGMKDEPGEEDDNNAPRFSEGDATSRAVPEDAEIGTEVGAPLIATDSDGDQLQYSLSGAGQDYFHMDSGTGLLTTARPLDYETQSEHSVQVSVRDGQGGIDNIDVTITVGDVDEPPSQPEAPEVRSAGLTSLAASWTEPDNQGPEITDYDVQYRQTGGEFQDAGYNGIGTFLALNDLSPTTGYEVQVRAINAEGISPWSESGRVETGLALSTPPPTPVLEITPTPDSAQAGIPTSTPGQGDASARTPTPTVRPMGTTAPAQTPGPVGVPSTVPATPPAAVGTVPTPPVTQAPSASVLEPTTAIPPAAQSEQDSGRGFPIWLIAAIVLAGLLAIVLGYSGVRMLRR